VRCGCPCGPAHASCHTQHSKCRCASGGADPPARARRLKYIEAELAKRRGAAGDASGSGGGADGAAGAGTLALSVASLYETPEELRVAEPPGGAEADEDGADRWLTGIVEVQLPVEYKLRNIEDTERAKAALLAAQRERAAAAARGERATPGAAAALAVGGEFARASLRRASTLWCVAASVR
jgi:hypothetical protein